MPTKNSSRAHLLATRVRRTSRAAMLAAVVAAAMVAGALVAGPWFATAAPGDTDSTYVAVAPCRVFDYRPEHNVGPRSIPLGPGEVHAQQITGAIGDCNVPTGATAVAMNVTVTRGTADSHLTIFPAHLSAIPNVSSLNWIAGQPATPNKVDVALSPGGAIKLHNHAGLVFVLADVVGYYRSDSLHDLHQRLDALEHEPRPFAVASAYNPSTSITSATTEIASVVVDAPAAGTVTLVGTGILDEVTSLYYVECDISTEVAFPPSGFGSIWTPAGTNDNGNIAVHRTVDVGPGPTEFFLICRADDGDAITWQPRFTALYVPD